MTITLEDLKAAGACHEALRAFAKAFPEGAPSIEAIADHPDCLPEWRGWMSVNLPQCDRETGLALLESSDDRTGKDGRSCNFWHGLSAVRAYWCDRETGLRLIEDSDNPKYWRAVAACNARWCDRETAMALIGNSDASPYQRAVVEARFAARQPKRRTPQ